MLIFVFIATILQTVCGSPTTFNVVVSQDGTGDYSTIGDAISTAPNRSTMRYYIYIKSGTYHEYLLIGKEKQNIALVGDGMDSVIITRSRSNRTGWKTLYSATVAIEGNGFTAINITFENTAGPDHGQAVAVRAKSEFSVFYRCRFLGFQDTLFIHSGIQFYRECEIKGTVDFIFRDATAVFQNCNIYARRPLQGQSNALTAQGRIANSQTGISIQNCTIMPAPDLAATAGVKTYLGRPWKSFSRTVIMQSTLYGFIDPAGWLEWDNTSASLNGIYYREYQNRGPGANTAWRVKWKGVGVMGGSSEAMEFSVRRFINGTEWLPSRGVPFFADLI